MRRGKIGMAAGREQFLQGGEQNSFFCMLSMYVSLIGHQGPTKLMTQSFGPKNTSMISIRGVEP